MEKTDKEIVRRDMASVRKGPMEGMVIVDGKPCMERSDMPTISFSEAGLKRLIEHYKGK